jgi:hypothetical protein
VHRQALFHVVHLLEDLPRTFEKEAPFFGQVHAPGGAVDQRGAQLALQARQVRLTADGVWPICSAAAEIEPQSMTATNTWSSSERFSRRWPWWGSH